MSFQICKLCIFSFDFILAKCTCIVVPTHTLSYLYLFIRCHKFTSVLSYLHIHCHFLSVRQCHIQLSFVLSALTHLSSHILYGQFYILLFVFSTSTVLFFVIYISCFVISTHTLSCISLWLTLFYQYFVMYLYLLLCHFYLSIVLSFCIFHVTLKCLIFLRSCDISDGIFLLPFT